MKKMPTDPQTEQSAYAALERQIEQDLARVITGNHEIGIWDSGRVYIKFVDDELGDEVWERAYYERMRNTTSIRRVYDRNVEDGVHEQSITIYEAVMGLDELRRLFVRTLECVKVKIEQSTEKPK